MCGVCVCVGVLARMWALFLSLCRSVTLSLSLHLCRCVSPSHTHTHTHLCGLLTGTAAKKDELRQDIERELETLWAQMKAYNRSKDLLRGMRTPLIFAAAAFVLNIVAAVLDVVELDPIAYVLNFVAWVGVFALVGWGTLNYTGQQPEIRGAMDAFADSLFQTSRAYVTQFATGQVPPREDQRAPRRHGGGAAADAASANRRAGARRRVVAAAM